MHLGLGGHVTLKWGMESELFQLNQLLYIISYIFFTLFMPKSEAQLKKKIVICHCSGSDEFDSRWIFYNLQVYR